jgi:hypothetical protein
MVHRPYHHTPLKIRLQDGGTFRIQIQIQSEEKQPPSPAKKGHTSSSSTTMQDVASRGGGGGGGPVAPSASQPAVVF